jgi:ABC-2 type transport system permease protein
MRFFWKLRAFIKRDLTTDLSYKLSFALEAAHVGIAVAAFYFFSQLLGSTRPQGYASFPFILVGMTVNAYMTTCLICFSQTIRGSQMAGTLKTILATPTSPTAFLVCSSTYPFIRASLDAAAYTIVGMLFGLSVSHVNALTAALVLVLSLLAFSSVGILSASFVLVFKRGDPLLWLFASGSWLLGGVLYPTDLLPPVLRHVATWLPITHAVNGMRAALLTGASPLAISRELVGLALFALVGVPLSLLVFRMGIEHAKRIGTLDHQ